MRALCDSGIVDRHARGRLALTPRLGLVRVIDESGEDYLYPKARFAAFTLPPSAARALAAAS